MNTNLFKEFTSFYSEYTFSPVDIQFTEEELSILDWLSQHTCTKRAVAQIRTYPHYYMIHVVPDESGGSIQATDSFTIAWCKKVGNFAKLRCGTYIFYDNKMYRVVDDNFNKFMRDFLSILGSWKNSIEPCNTFPVDTILTKNQCYISRYLPICKFYSSTYLIGGYKTYISWTTHIAKGIPSEVDYCPQEITMGQVMTDIHNRSNTKNVLLDPEFKAQ